MNKKKSFERLRRKMMDLIKEYRNLVRNEPEAHLHPCSPPIGYIRISRTVELMQKL